MRSLHDIVTARSVAKLADLEVVVWVCSVGHVGRDACM